MSRRRQGAILVVLMLTAAACDRATGRATIPDTVPGRVLSSWLDAYNAADSSRLMGYARQHEPVFSLGRELALRVQTGRLELASVERSGPRHLEVVLKTRADTADFAAPSTVYAMIDVADSMSGMATRSATLMSRGPVRSVPRLSASHRHAVIDSLAAKLDRKYVIPDVGRRVVDSLRARAARGMYDDLDTEVRLAFGLDRDLVTLSGDRQLRVEYAWRVPLPLPPSSARCGFHEPSRLAGGVVLLRLDDFSDPEPPCGQEVSTVMNSVASAPALIIDLRESAGGSPAMMTYVSSYLMGGCAHLDDVWERRSGQSSPNWTLDGLPGEAFGGSKPLYVLTSARTMGTAEELASALQSAGRAVVVGETTGGGAYITGMGRIGEHLLVQIPIGQVLDPATRTNWEGVGIVPDVRTAGADALATAQRMIRERAVSQRVTASRRDRRAAAARDLSRVERTDVASVKPPEPTDGIRFTIDTVGAAIDGRDALARIGGRVEFANGRGRLDVATVRAGPTTYMNGIVIGTPSARPGDYYLFDNTGFILVHPASRTYARASFFRADFNHTGALLPGAFLMHNAPIRVDTVPRRADDSNDQHADVSVHWHMQPPSAGQVGRLYARGWLELPDVPAIEAGVARWFEVAAALATAPGELRAIRAGGLEVTSVALLRPRSARTVRVTYPVMLTPRHLTGASVRSSRLVLPPGYREVPWSALGRASQFASAGATAGHWRVLEGTFAQYRRATCRQAWLPERSSGAL